MPKMNGFHLLQKRKSARESKTIFKLNLATKPLQCELVVTVTQVGAANDLQLDWNVNWDRGQADDLHWPRAHLTQTSFCNYWELRNTLRRPVKRKLDSWSRKREEFLSRENSDFCFQQYVLLLRFFVFVHFSVISGVSSFIQFFVYLFQVFD